MIHEFKAYAIRSHLYFQTRPSLDLQLLTKAAVVTDQNVNKNVRDRRKRKQVGCTHALATTSTMPDLDHFLSFESLLMRKMPVPWLFPHGFIIQVEFGFFLKTNIYRVFKCLSFSTFIAGIT